MCVSVCVCTHTDAHTNMFCYPFLDLSLFLSTTNPEMDSISMLCMRKLIKVRQYFLGITWNYMYFGFKLYFPSDQAFSSYIII